MAGVQLAPPFDEVLNFTCSRLSPSRPSTHEMTIRFVAPVPLGALLAMSTDGAGERSLRAPPTPSITQRPIDGSNALQVSNAGNSRRGRSHVRPPSNERIISVWPSAALSGS